MKATGCVSLCCYFLSSRRHVDTDNELIAAVRLKEFQNLNSGQQIVSQETKFQCGTRDWWNKPTFFSDKSVIRRD